MTADETRTRMADYLDDLLDDDERAAAEADIARMPALFAEVARMRAVLYRPYAVVEPDPGQRARILARWRNRPWRHVLRYAAVFAAGVVTTFVLRAASPPPPPVAPETPARHEVAPPAPVSPMLPRRIR